MTPYFEQVFLTGAIMAPWSPPYGSQLFVYVHNPTGTEETVRALGFTTSGQWFDSDVDFDPEAGPFNGRIPADSVWLYPRRMMPDDPRLLWIAIWSTSAQLVPSVQLLQVELGEDNLPHSVGFEWISPGDFAIRRSPFKFPKPEVIGPTDIGPVVT